MNSSSRKTERLPMIAGGLAMMTGLALSLNGASQAMTVVGAVLLMIGIIATVAAVLGSYGRSAAGTAEGVPNSAQTGPTGPTGSSPARRTDDPLPAGSASGVGAVAQPALRTGDWLTQCLLHLVQSFNTWFEQQGVDEHLWPAFDRWVRDALNQSMRARRVRCFRTCEGANRLVSLTTELEEPLWPAGALPGLVEHVLTTGRPYVKGDRNNGDLIERLTNAWCMDPNRGTGPSTVAPHWLLPIRRGNKTLGLILAGELGEPTLGDAAGLGTAGALLNTLWRCVDQTEALAVAQKTDHPSGVLTRTDLTHRAEKMVAECAGDGEPVVLIALAVEGVRRLNDQGHWELRDQLMREIGNQMRRKLRSDDLVGRFSEDRFVAVLRRLDLALGEMISRKLLAAVETAVHEQPVLDETVRIRCGLTDTGPDGFEAAVTRAFHAINEARREGLNRPLALSRREHEQAVFSGATA